MVADERDDPLTMIISACAAPTTEAPKKFVFGLIMVGPKEDHGWNEAHWTAAQDVLKNVPNTDLVWIDKVNPADRPGVTIEQVSDDLVAKGAKVIFTNSAEFKGWHEQRRQETHRCDVHSHQR